MSIIPDHPTSPTIAGQKQTADALAAMAAVFGHLPAPYVTVQQPPAARLDLQLQSAAAFEQWRAALGINPATVELRVYGGSTWLAGDGSFMGVPVAVSGYGIAVSSEDPPEPVAVCHDAELRAGHPGEAHLLDDDEAFASLAVVRPEACSTAADYPGWTPGTPVAGVSV